MVLSEPGIIRNLRWNEPCEQPCWQCSIEGGKEAAGETENGVEEQTDLTMLPEDVTRIVLCLLVADLVKEQVRLSLGDPLSLSVEQPEQPLSFC